MRKYPLIGSGICAVALIVLASLTNVVGYQTVQASQQNIIKERINQRDLLFQTIVNIANTKQIQRIILQSQISRGLFSGSDVPLVTKNQIRQMYLVGLILSKSISRPRIQLMIQHYLFRNQEAQNKISSVIEKDAILREEIIQLKNSKCDCENEKTVQWEYPVICASLYLIFFLLCIPYGLLAGLFDIFHDSVLGILIVPWMILVEIIAIPIGILLVLFGCLDIPIPGIHDIKKIGN